MGFFDDDPFEDIVNEFLGRSRQRRTSSGNVVHGEKEERVIDYIEEDDYVYFVFELFGYNKEDISVNINGKELEISAIKKDLTNVQDYLSAKLSKGIYFKKSIPNGIKNKKFDWIFNNGVLEVRFKRK